MKAGSANRNPCIRHTAEKPLDNWTATARKYNQAVAAAKEKLTEHNKTNHKKEAGAQQK